jgi:hypothetical protein
VRLLVCNTCGCEVELHEEPVEFVDPERFHCGPCMGDQRNGAQLVLVGTTAKPARRTETRSYDPALAAISY